MCGGVRGADASRARFDPAASNGARARRSGSGEPGRALLEVEDRPPLCLPTVVQLETRALDVREAMGREIIPRRANKVGDASVVANFAEFTNFFLWLLRRLRSGDEKLREQLAAPKELWAAIDAAPTAAAVAWREQREAAGLCGEDVELTFEAGYIASARNDFAVRAAVTRAHDTARACRLACAIGHARRARYPDSGSRATSRSRAHQ